jgi:hypothetical protein
MRESTAQKMLIKKSGKPLLQNMLQAMQSEVRVVKEYTYRYDAKPQDTSTTLHHITTQSQRKAMDLLRGELPPCQNELLRAIHQQV